MYLCRLGRECPDLSCEVVFRAERMEIGLHDGSPSRSTGNPAQAERDHSDDCHFGRIRPPPQDATRPANAVAWPTTRPRPVHCLGILRPRINQKFLRPRLCGTMRAEAPGYVPPSLRDKQKSQHQKAQARDAGGGTGCLQPGCEAQEAAEWFIMPPAAAPHRLPATCATRGHAQTLRRPNFAVAGMRMLCAVPALSWRECVKLARIRL